MLRVGLPVLCLLTSALGAVADEAVDATTYFVDWSAFFAEDVCWVATLVDFGAHDDEIEVYFTVSFFRQSAVPHISVMTGSGEVFAEAPVAFVGANMIEFEVFDDSAFPLVEDEETLLWALLDEQLVKLHAFGEPSTQYEGVVAVSGFRDAYNFIARECEFNFNQELSDSIGVEPT